MSRALCLDGQFGAELASKMHLRVPPVVVDGWYHHLELAGAPHHEHLGEFHLGDRRPLDYAQAGKFPTPLREGTQPGRFPPPLGEGRLGRVAPFIRDGATARIANPAWSPGRYPGLSL